MIENKAPSPHCDNFVLHRDCQICNEFPELQKQRELSEMNFTGEQIPSKLQCPAEQRRSLRDINKWYGNRVEPVTKVMIYKGSKDIQ